MREIKAGTYIESVDPNEVFKYVTKLGTEYLLMCLHEGSSVCMGCAFSAVSDHPLSHTPCSGNGLNCDHKIFKALDTILEDL